MAHDLRPLQGEGTGGFRVVPIETDHDPDASRADVPDPESRVARAEKQRFLTKQMRLAVTPQEPRRTHHDRRVVALPAGLLRQSHDQMHPMPAGKLDTGFGRRSGRHAFRQLEDFLLVHELIPGKGKFRQHEQVALHRTQAGSHLLDVAVHFPEHGMRLKIADFHP